MGEDSDSSVVYKYRRSRRSVLVALSGLTAVGLAGCSGGGGGNGETETGRDDGETGDGTPTETRTSADATPTPADADDLTPWWTSHADPERTRSTPDPVPGSLEQVGTFKFSSTSQPRTYPLVTTEGLFVFHDESITRYDLASRQQAFQRSVGFAFPFVRDGTIVVVGSNFNLLGLNASSGEREWIASVDLRRGQIRSVSPVPGGVLVVEASGVRVLEVESGEERWSKTGFGTNESGFNVNKLGEVKPMQSGNYPYRPPVHSESDTVFVGHGTHVDALDARTGDRQWRFTRDKEFENFTAKPAPLAVRGETVYVSDRDGILALDRGDGSVSWKRTPSDPSENPFTPDFAYAVDDTALYYWNSAGEVRALSVDDGSDLWSTAFTGRVTSVGSAVAGDGVVFTTANSLQVLSKSTGESRLSTDLKDPRGVVPAGGRLYVVNFSESGRAQITVFGSS